jgi:hypothetical protein
VITSFGLVQDPSMYLGTLQPAIARAVQTQRSASASPTNTPHFWVGNSTIFDLRLVEPEWLAGFNANIRRVERLKAGWDGLNSVPVDRNVLYQAARIVRDALEGFDRATAPYLSPAGDGSVQVEWHEKDAEIELLLLPDGTKYLWARDHLSGTEFEADDEAALDFFSRWAPRLATSAVYGSIWSSEAQSPVVGTSASVSFYPDSAVA